MRRIAIALWWVLMTYAVLQGSGIVPPVIPQLAPVANKQGNSTKFQLAGTNSGTLGNTLCNDASGNATDAGCSSGGGNPAVILGSLPRLVISMGADLYCGLVFSTRNVNTAPPSFANNNWTPISRAGTLQDFYFDTVSDQDVDDVLTATLMIDGVDTTLVVTVPAASVAGVYHDTTHTVAVTAGQRISIHVSNASGTSTTVGDWGVSLQ